MEQTKKKPAITKPSDGGSLSFKVDLPQNDYVTCEICGHQNPPNAGLCEMCSAYLFKLKNK